MDGIETDYLVIGAGAMGMAFTDALIDHADVDVTLVDRRPAAGGHWNDAYPFVQLHQASLFYGVASRQLGSGTLQSSGPEVGLHERARSAEIRAYYDDILYRHFLGSGRVTFLGSSCYIQRDGRQLVTSLVSGQTTEVMVRRRLVDATLLSPDIPATTPPPFAVADDATVVPINDLAKLAEVPKEFVIVGSGKTATDGIIWLLKNGVAPDRIVWVRPRDPWMLNRSVVQPDPVFALRYAAEILSAATQAKSLEELFLRLEEAGIMLRLDRNITPTMAKTPTLARWELDLLGTVERVVRQGHVKAVGGGEILLDRATIPLPVGALVVHCAASGFRYPPLVPIWGRDAIRLQGIRAGFPCFCAALAGFVEAVFDDDRERNRLCPANMLPDSPRTWAEMQLRSVFATRHYGADPAIANWANQCGLNPARLDPSRATDSQIVAAQDRLAAVVEGGISGLSRLTGVATATL